MEITKKLLEEFVIEGLSNVKIGLKIGLHNTTVGRLLKKYGIVRIAKQKNITCVICGNAIKINKRNRKTCGACAVRVFRYKMKVKAVEYKGGKCVMCEYNKSLSALQFHHTEPNQKKIGIGDNINRPWDSIKSELDKCILLCGNCHSEIHSKQKDEKLILYINDGAQAN